MPTERDACAATVTDDGQGKLSRRPDGVHRRRRADLADLHLPGNDEHPVRGAHGRRLVGYSGNLVVEPFLRGQDLQDLDGGKNLTVQTTPEHMSMSPTVFLDVGFRRALGQRLPAVTGGWGGKPGTG